MKNISAVQIFAVMAILVGLLVSYYPPLQNGPAIWGLVGTFIGFCMKDLFAARSVGDFSPPNATAPDKPAA